MPCASLDAQRLHAMLFQGKAQEIVWDFCAKYIATKEKKEVSNKKRTKKSETMSVS